MAEYIGSRISLISKRDIRYVGTLHEISSENSTVALEQVVSWGTEGRRPGEEVAPTPDKVYEYIVFRGSDVKDLRIEKEPEKQQQQVPDDPAILGNSRPAANPSSSTQDRGEEPQQAQFYQQSQNQFPYNQQQGRAGPPPRFQQPPLPYNYHPSNQRFGPPSQYGFPPQGYPGMPYSPAQGWYPPPGQGYPHPPPGQFPSYNMPSGPPVPLENQQQPSSKPPTPAESFQHDAPAPSQHNEPLEKPIATVKLPSNATTPAPSAATNGPLLPNDSKPDIATALAPPVPTTAAVAAAPKSGRIMPAVPIISPAAKFKAPVNSVAQPDAVNATSAATAASKSEALHPPKLPAKSLEDANRDARAAVAAAMAKLPPATGQKKQLNGENAMDNLTNKLNEMRTNDNIRTSRQPGTGGYAAMNRGGRGGYRGGRPRTESQIKKVEVPKTDYDFASANAKFNKQDLAKEAIASGSPLGSPVNGFHDDIVEPAVAGGRRESKQNTLGTTRYNKTSSFFDNISSETKDRDDSKKLGGREFRSEEQKKNLETFGQGSVDNGYRGGFRGRGRRGYRGGRSARGGRGGMRVHDTAVAGS